MMRLPHPPEQTLFQFLKSAFQAHLGFVSGASLRAEAPVPIYVIGNPAADLDSIVSALIYSYFANNRVPRGEPRPHIPLINLANVNSGAELRRLRPEFAKALWLSTHDPAENDSPWQNTSETAGGSILQEHILTVADFAEHLQSQGPSANTDRRLCADAVLVDWNALPIRSADGHPGKGSLSGLSAVDFTVVGCIDHHADEHFLPPISDTQPYLVESAGSCASLVVKILEKMDLWQTSMKKDPHDAPEVPIREKQVAKLAMAPILIDTANLTAKDKVTDFDTAAYFFLTPKIIQPPPSSKWDPEGFYTEIQETKQNSLDLLTVDEILDRDYKEWTEKPSSGKTSSSSSSSPSPPLQIGICSMVKSIPWIVRKAGSAQSFLDSLESFATQRELDIIIVMTAFTSSVKTEGQFCRELLACGMKNPRSIDALKAFVSEAGPQLGLEEWTPLDGDEHASALQELLHEHHESSIVWRRIWTQTNVTKSRKQVAPLIRGAVASL